MRCPICKREFVESTSKALPFCSERCRTIDVGRWLGENYSIPVTPDPDAEPITDEPMETNGDGVPRERE